MDILYKENNNKLKFGQQKVAILHTVAQSLVETFPRLKSPIHLIENPELKHVSCFIFSFKSFTLKKNLIILEKPVLLQSTHERKKGPLFTSL